MKNAELRIAFWGTSAFSVGVLEALAERGVLPDIIITAPDKPKGRNLIVTPPLTKKWAETHFISTFQPATLDAEAIDALNGEGPWDLFIVASYGKIIPQAILDIPKHGTLNVHPSLLPKLRGASPIQSAILGEDKTGVTIIRIDEKMDHGPIVAQKEVAVFPWPPKASELERVLAREGGKLLAEIIPKWTEGKINAREQEHDQATYTKKFSKEDGLIDLAGDPLTNFKKIQAFDVWPRTYFFTERHGKKIRVAITEADFADGKLVIKKVIPEGKKEMRYEDFLRGAATI
jgi:methionyl-tRNA formyltransferase